MPTWSDNGDEICRVTKLSPGYQISEPCVNGFPVVDPQVILSVVNGIH